MSSRGSIAFPVAESASSGFLYPPAHSPRSGKQMESLTVVWSSGSMVVCPGERVLSLP